MKKCVGKEYDMMVVIISMISCFYLINFKDLLFDVLCCVVFVNVIFFFFVVVKLLRSVKCCWFDFWIFGIY